MQKDYYVVQHTTQAVVALVMYCMHNMWKCKPKTCKKRFDDIRAMLEIPQIFGNEIKDIDMMKFCKDELDIDVSELNMKVRFVNEDSN